MSEAAPGAISIPVNEARFLAPILRGLADVVELDGAARLPDELFNLIAGPPGSLDTSMGIDRRQIVSAKAREIGDELDSKLTGH